MRVPARGQNLVVPLPALGKKGGAVTADSPCSCTAESRDCRARSSLHVGDRYPIVSRRSCSSTSARMNIFSSLVLLSLPCRVAHAHGLAPLAPALLNPSAFAPPPRRHVTPARSSSPPPRFAPPHRSQRLLAPRALSALPLLPSSSP